MKLMKGMKDMKTALTWRPPTAATAICVKAATDKTSKTSGV